MQPHDDASVFGEAADCTSLREVIKLIGSLMGDRARAAAAAYGMLLVAKSARPGPYRESALEALNQLARAKAELDIAALHLPPVIEVTAQLLLAAQRYADEATIPCTEWPSVQEIAAVVHREALELARDPPRP